MLVVEGVLLTVAFAEGQGFVDGVLAADPHASGTYTWHALAPVLRGEDLVLSGGRLESLGFTFSAPLAVAAAALGAVVFVIGAHAWRRRPAWRRR